jgi:hypothetical protein
MKTILFALLVTGVASAEPMPAPPAHAEKPAKLACEAKGTPVFETERHDKGSDKWMLAGKLYATGAWTFSETTAAGKPGAAKAGCVAEAELKTVKAELAAAKWTVTTARIHCMAMATSFTIYKANGKQVFESAMCNGKSLDEASEKARKDAELLLEPAFKDAKPPQP